MGILPSTGTEISMGKIARALGIADQYPPTSSILLNNTLGGNRSLSLSSVSNIPPATDTKESEDFGGLATTNDYPT
jgi:hypothetical protein